MEVLLRDVLEADLPILFEHQLDPAAARMAAFEPRDREAFMEHWTSNILADETVIKKAVVFGGQVVGYIVSFVRSGRREIGYWIARDHWGKGIATRALSQLLGCVAERPLYAITAKHNIASIRVLEKCGFTIEGQTRGDSGGRGPVVDECVLRLGP